MFEYSTVPKFTAKEPPTINMTYSGNTTRTQQKQTPDLRLLLLYFLKKHKKKNPKVSKLFVK